METTADINRPSTSNWMVIQPLTEEKSGAGESPALVICDEFANDSDVIAAHIRRLTYITISGTMQFADVDAPAVLYVDAGTAPFITHSVRRLTARIVTDEPPDAIWAPTETPVWVTGTIQTVIGGPRARLILTIPAIPGLGAHLVFFAGGIAVRES